MANARRRTQRTNRTATRMAARNTGATASAAVIDSEEPRAGKVLDWENDMKYINKDLRELLIISASLFIALFVVGFFLG